MATIYNSKVNLNSHILEVYKENIQLPQILEKIFTFIFEEVSYSRKEEYKIDSENSITYQANFKFSNLTTEELSNGKKVILGNIIKSAPIFTKEHLEDIDTMQFHKTDNDEKILFIFFPLDEIVMFHTTQRFGFKEFNLAFGGLISETLTKNSDEKFCFNVELLKKELDFDQIREEIKGIGEITELIIEINPPNPPEELLQEILEDAEGQIEEIRDSNVTKSRVTFESKAPGGMDIDRGVVKEKMDSISAIHSKLTAEDALEKGYAKVEAKNKEGRKFSTEGMKPITYEIPDNNKNKIGFLNIAIEILNKIL